MIPAVGYTWRGILDGLLCVAEESVIAATDHVVREVRKVGPRIERARLLLPRRLTLAYLTAVEPVSTLARVSDYLLSDWSDDAPTLEEIRRHSLRAGYWAGWGNWQIMLPTDQTVMIEHIELNAHSPDQIAERLAYAARQGACSYRALDLGGDPCWWWREPRKAAR